ncbi:MAG TPA: glycosyltransferase [Ignavibacteria bacterium]|nr:glycosyltransferase [Ignavibacteria bacterium]
MKRKIRILYTIPNFNTAGSGKALLNIASRLDRNKFEPHLCCAHTKGGFFEKVKESGIPVHIFQSWESVKLSFENYKKISEITRNFKKIKPDIIHSFHYSSDFSEAIAAKMSGSKWIFTKKNMSWGSASWKIRSYLSDAIITTNSDMIKEFYQGNKKLHLISRGVNTNEFVPFNRNDELYKELGFNEKDRILITVANIVPVKGIEILLKAFQKVSETSPDCKLIILGDYNSDYAMKLKENTERSSLNGKVIFPGKVLNVKEYLNISELFILPTLKKGEGSPVSVLEAMALKKYVLGSDVPGIRDLLSSFKELLFEAENSDDLALKINFFLNLSKDQIEKKGNELRDEVLNNFTIDIEVKKHEEIYEKLAGN